MTDTSDTPSKIDEDVEKETKQPLPDAPVYVISTTDHQQPLDKTTNNVKDAAEAIKKKTHKHTI